MNYVTDRLVLLRVIVLLHWQHVATQVEQQVTTHVFSVNAHYKAPTPVFRRPQRPAGCKITFAVYCGAPPGECVCNFVRTKTHPPKCVKLATTWSNLLKRVEAKTACHLFFSDRPISFLLLFVVYTPHLRGDVCMKGWTLEMQLVIITRLLQQAWCIHRHLAIFAKYRRARWALARLQMKTKKFYDNAFTSTNKSVAVFTLKRGIHNARYMLRWHFLLEQKCVWK